MRTLKKTSCLNKYKVSRNDRCLCGSGKKYKKCCLLDVENFEGLLDVENFEGKDSIDQTALLQTMGEKVKKQYKDDSMIMGTSDELGLDRMSEILLEFAKELLENANNDQEKEGIIMMAIVAWNISIVADEDPESAIDHIEDYLRTLGFKKKSEDKEVVAFVLLTLVEKKWMEYPDVQRFIVGFEVIETKNEFRLNVASLVAPANKSALPFLKGNKKMKN